MVLVSILSFIVLFVVPVAILVLVIMVYHFTRNTEKQLDSIQSRVDLLIQINKIDLGNLPISNSLSSRLKREILMTQSRSGALYLIQHHLGVNRKPAGNILDRYEAEHKLGPLKCDDNTSDEASS